MAFYVTFLIRFLLLVANLNGDSFAIPLENAASINGVLLDRNGVVLPGVKITLIKSHQVVAEVSTGVNGEFVVANIPSGQYDVRVELPGYFMKTFPNVFISAGQQQGVKFQINDFEIAPPPPAPPPPPSALEQTHKDFTEPMWNIWTEENSDEPKFKPVTMLPGKQYLLVVDLSGLPYELYDETGVVSSPKVGPSLKDWLLHSADKSAQLTVLILPDDKSFEPQADTERVKTMTVDLDKIRSAITSGFDSSGIAA